MNRLCQINSVKLVSLHRSFLASYVSLEILEGLKLKSGKLEACEYIFDTNPHMNLNAGRDFHDILSILPKSGAKFKENEYITSHIVYIKCVYTQHPDRFTSHYTDN